MELGKLIHLLLSYTKMGYAGNMEPNYLIPTSIAEAPEVRIYLTYYNSKKFQEKAKWKFQS